MNKWQYQTINYGSKGVVLGYNSTYFHLLQAFEETPTHMSIKINRLEKGHNSYPLVCRRPAETVSLQRRKICYRWGTPAYWSLVPRSSMFYLYSKDLLDNLKSRSFSQVSSIKIFDFSTLYTTLPHDKLKTRLKKTIHQAFSHRTWEKDLDFRLSKRSLEFFKIHYASKQFHNISEIKIFVGLYVVLLEVLLFMPNSLIRHSK
jgi:hypothetical protein